MCFKFEKKMNKKNERPNESFIGLSTENIFTYCSDQIV